MRNLTTIVTLRHGETAFNVEQRYAGTLDISLNENGKKDALLASQRLNGMMRFDTIICSRLKRSYETACYFKENCGIVETELCNERNYGKLEGLLISEAKTAFPEIKYWQTENDSHSLDPPQAESFEKLHERAKQFLQFVFTSFRGKSVLVVSHATFLQQFHGALKNQNWKSSLGNCLANLECCVWCFDKSSLIESKTIPLVNRTQNTW